MTVFDGHDYPEDNGDEFYSESPAYYTDEPLEEYQYGRRARRSVEDDIAAAIEAVRTAKSIPLSQSAMIPRDELLATLEDAQRNLPEELLEARRALRDREQLMAEETRRAETMIETARVRAAQLVDGTEIVLQARLTAEKIIADAEARARAMVNQTEDFLDTKLAEYENSIAALMKTVQRGRARLASQQFPEPTNPVAADEFFADQPKPAAAVFDYDEDVEDVGRPSDF